MVKKGEKKKKGKGAAPLVKEAILDLDKEISRIRKEKSSLNSKLRNIDTSLENTRELEKKLQNRIARLENSEAALIDKKKKLKQKGDFLGERLSKVSTIKEQLGEV